MFNHKQFRGYTVLTAVYVHASETHLRQNLDGYLRTVGFPYLYSLADHGRRWFQNVWNPNVDARGRPFGDNETPRISVTHQNALRSRDADNHSTRDRYPYSFQRVAIRSSISLRTSATTSRWSSGHDASSPGVGAEGGGWK